ncbi:phage tail length tape measure family protein [Caulobacter segnis]|uniref:Bacteriophage tail tape measure N-terminal domain-containing protein n=1 Tax=Caulobacter segnis TaxID=88688 RepID=A0A2W5V909_9CAUL|nr:phage tail length tape measure family protein [Caulobacter segnis]PZR36499.1 MAG: hypothetical protein DI526_03420 [Caulobacter segnis]
MTEATLAVLNMEIRAKDATTAAQQLERLTKAASDVDAAFGRAGQAASTAGAATGRVEQSLRPLIAVYGQARDALGRFTDQDGSFRHSQDATAKMLLQNAKTVEAYERQIEKATKQVEALTRAFDPVGAEILKTNRQIEQASKLQGDQSKIVDGLKGKLATLEKAHAGAANGAKLQSYQLLNLGRQFTDVGVSIASGQPVWMVAIQQGAQIGEVFAEARTQGVSLKSALGSVAAVAVDMVKKFAPLIGTGAILGGVALAAYGVWTEIKKTQQAMKDLEAATNEANAAIANARETMKEASLGAGTFGQESLGAAFGIKSFAGEVGDAAVKLYDFAAAAKTATVNGLMAQRVALSEKIAKLEERSTEGRRSALTGQWTPARIAEKLGNRIGGDLLSLWTGGESDRNISNDIGAAKSAMKELEAALTDVLNKDLKGWADEGRAALGDLGKKTKEQVKELAGLKPFDESKLLKATDEVWPYMADVIQATEKRTRDLNAATQDLDRTLEAIRIPSDLENLASELEEQAKAVRDLRYDFEDLAYAINENDWVSAFAGLVNVLAKVETAFKNAKTSQDKFAAAAMLAQGVGSAVGGTGGNVLAGAGSGALAGLSAASALTTLGVVSGPVGWAALGIGAVVGGLGGLFGSSSKKKKARQQAAAQAAAEEAQRQQTIADTAFSLDVALLRAQGKELEAVAKERDKELARLTALSPSLAETQKQLYALEDAASAAAKAAEQAAAVEAKRQSIQDEIDKLTLSSADLLLKARAKERAEAVALDPALGDLIDKLYGLQDAATASAEAAKADQDAMAQASAAWAEQQRLSTYLTDQATKALEAQASAAQAVSDVFGVAIKASEDLEKSLRSFADSLGLADEATAAASYAQAKAAFVSSRGADQQISERFLSASAALNGDSLAYQLDRALVRSATLGVANQQAGARDGIASLFRGLEAQGLLPGASSFSIAPTPTISASDMAAPIVAQPTAGNDNGTAGLVSELRALRQEVAQLRAEAARGADASEASRDQLRHGTLAVEQV